MIMCESCPDAHAWQAVRANIVRTVTLILDNDYGSYKTITADVEALSTYDTCVPGRDDHEECDTVDPCQTMADWPTLRDVGDVVVSFLEDVVIGESDDMATMILRDLLDLGDSQLIEQLGRHYYPEDALRALRDAS